MVTGKPVTGKITGHRFQFSITGYRFTNTFSSRNANFGFSFVSHTHTGNKDRSTLDPDIPAPSTAQSRWSSLLLSPPRAGSTQLGKAGGKSCELDGRRG